MSSSFRNQGTAAGNIAGAALCLLPATRDVHELVAGILAEHHILFERRGPMLALVDHGEPGRAIEILRHVLTDMEKQDLAVASAGTNGFPERRTLDDWWRFRETAWFDGAMSRTAFSIWFQPLIDTSRAEAPCDRVFGYECLARFSDGNGWSRRTRAGGEIMEAAQLRRQEGQLDTWLGHQAILRTFETGAEGKIFINFLPQTVKDPAVSFAVALQAMRSLGIPAGKIVFEAVQSFLFEPAHLVGIADFLRRAGCGVSLDDVGAGRTGQVLIREVRPDYAKLAVDLAQNLESPACATAVRRILDVAEMTGTVVIGTHVESIAEMQNFWLLGVQHLQGHLFGQAAPAPVIPHLDLMKLALEAEGEEADLAYAH